MIGSVSGVISGANDDDICVVSGCVTQIGGAFVVGSSLEAQIAIGINLEYGSISAAIKRPGDGFIGRELRNSGCIFCD